MVVEVVVEVLMEQDPHLVLLEMSLVEEEEVSLMM